MSLETRTTPPVTVALFIYGDVNMKINNRSQLYHFIAQLREWQQQPASLLTVEQREAISMQLEQIVNYRAVVGVLGKTGAGKSSLCNALFGQDVAKVSDVDACTREPQQIQLGREGRNGIALLDMPGVGESEARDHNYRKLYQRWLPKLDLVLWVIKADDRALSIDERFYRDVVLPLLSERGVPILFVISQADKLEPCREWDWTRGQPGPMQAQNLQAKHSQLSAVFRISPQQVVATSAEASYGLTRLIEQIVLILPDEKKWGLVRETRDAHISKECWQETGTGLWQAVKNTAKRLVGAAWKVVKTVLFKRVSSWLGI